MTIAGVDLAFTFFLERGQAVHGSCIACSSGSLLTKSPQWEAANLHYPSTPPESRVFLTKTVKR